MNAENQVKRGHVIYDLFTCESCGVQGELSVPVPWKAPFSCPASCGAVYVQWRYEGKWQLKCVVKPIFREDEEK